MKHINKFYKVVILPIAFIISLNSSVQGQSNPPDSQVDSSGKKEKKISFAPVPYLSYDRSIGFTFGAVPMIMYRLNKKDTISPKSLSGIAGIYATSGTWVGMFFSKMYLNEDRYRVTLAGGLMSVNFQFYLEDPYYTGYINYSTGVDGVFAEVQRKIANHLYFGLNFRYAQIVTNYDIEGAEEEISHLYGLGAV